MEKLTVKNFLTIREAELEVTPFTIIIGPQASGKSVLAKLVYFFRSFWGRDFHKAIEYPDPAPTLEEQFQLAFEKVFPAYGWDQQAFELKYQTSGASITLTSSGITGDAHLAVSFSQPITTLFTKARTQFKKDQQAENAGLLAALPFPNTSLGISLDGLSLLGLLIKRDVFIPASRAFFANLSSAPFSSLSQGFLIDPFLLQFGTLYEQAKRRQWVQEMPKAIEPYGYGLEAFESGQQAIQRGIYKNINNEDWIDQDGRLVRLQHASSGQQESLPMLLVLWHHLATGRGASFIVEEPEAHLFPTAQKQVVDLFSILHSATESEFLLTTHSPYILSALNVLVQADDLIREKPETEAQVRQLLGHGRPVAYENVRVYALRDGLLTLEMNAENRLIGENVLDEVSTEFEHVFNELLALQYPPDEVA